jgi:hypothetical protein
MAKKAKTKLRKVPARKKACAPLAPKFKLLDGHHLKFAFAQDGFTYSPTATWRRVRECSQRWTSTMNLK